MTGNELKKKREEINFSQENLARILEISNSTVARWEQLKEKEIPNGKMLLFALERISLEQLKKYVESTSESELLKKIQFNFDSIAAWNGWLETHFINNFVPLEIVINTEKLKSEGKEVKDNKDLRKLALEQFKANLGLNRPSKVKGEK